MAINQHLIDQARMLFFQYQDASTIAKKLDIPYERLKNWIYRGTGYDKKSWNAERAEQTKDILSTVKERNRVVISNIFKIGLPLIEKAVKDRANQEHPLTISEAKLLTDILMSFDKIERLEENKPTEIFDNQKNVSLEELRRAVLSDPFIDINLKKGIDYGTEPIDSTGGDSTQDLDAGRHPETKGDPLAET